MTIKNKHFFLKASILFSIIFWLIDIILDYYIGGEIKIELITSDTTQLNLEFIIIVLLILIGMFVDYHTNKVAEKEAEKIEVYQAMLGATNHILNNFLNNMMLFRMKADTSDDFDEELLKLYDSVISDASEQIKNLDDIQKPGKYIIEQRYKPT